MSEEIKKTSEETADKKHAVASGKVRRKNPGRKFAENFLAEDLRSVKDFIFVDVLVPAIKDTIVKIVDDGIHTLVYGDAAPRRDSGYSGSSYRRSSNIPRVSYMDYSRRGDSPNERRRDRKEMSYFYDDILYGSASEADKVLIAMEETLDRYGVVTVMDMFDFAGVSGSYTDNNYGWTNIDRARVKRVRDGWMIELPKAMPVD